MEHLLLHQIISLSISDTAVKTTVKLFSLMEFIFKWILEYYIKDTSKIRASKRVWCEASRDKWENGEKNVLSFGVEEKYK